MNRTAKIAIAAALSSLALAGVSRAQSLGMNTTPDIEQTLRTFQGSAFNIKPIHDYASLDGDTNAPASAPERSMWAIDGIQASIDANRPLARELSQQGVSVRNVVNAEQAADGSLTFYVR
ncbi:MULTISPECIES: hypothetical protein [unclassified Sinorhizobium]|uniref:hypothetical protein n=1 Tax=unclassified Sinorhizobium TaxID=2613772 RepID=UPI0035260677